MQIIRRLKNRIDDLNPQSYVYICLKPLQNNGFIRFGIAQISKTPAGLELVIDRGISETKTIKYLKVMLEECKDKDNIGYILIEKEFDIQRGGGIDGYQIINGQLYLTSILFPRIG